MTMVMQSSMEQKSAQLDGEILELRGYEQKYLHQTIRPIQSWQLD